MFWCNSTFRFVNRNSKSKARSTVLGKKFDEVHTCILKDFHVKIFEQSEFVKAFVRFRLLEPYARNAKNIGDHHSRFGDKLCGRPCFKTSVIVAIVKFIYFWRKIKAF